MSHKDIIIDTDAKFEIDPATREIKNVASEKSTVIQYDHNSERFGFVLPRYIEGHDMMACNRVEIHYKNTDSESQENDTGIYEVTDLRIDSDDNEKVVFSWLVSQNATQRVGALVFLVRFSCVDKDGTVNYAWNTAIFKGIFVSSGMFNSGEIAKQYTDVLEQWKVKLEEAAKLPLIVNITTDSDGTFIIADKTYYEIYDAYNAGRTVLSYVNYTDIVSQDASQTTVLTLVQCGDKKAVFSKLKNVDENICQEIIVTVESSYTESSPDTWSIETVLIPSKTYIDEKIVQMSGDSETVVMSQKAVTDEFDLHYELVGNSADGITPLICSVVLGYLNTNGVLQASSTRITTKNYIKIKEPIVLRSYSGYNFIVCRYDDSFELLSRTVSNGNSVTVPENTYFRVSMFYSDNRIIDETNIYELRKSVYYSPELSLDNYANSTINAVKNGKASLPCIFVVGNLGATGVHESSSNRIHSLDTMVFDDDVTLNLKKGYRAAVCLYQDDGTFISRPTMASSVNQYTVPAKTAFKLVIFKEKPVPIDENELREHSEAVWYTPKFVERVSEVEKDLETKSLEIVERISKAEQTIATTSLDFLRCFTSFTAIGDSLMAGFTSDGVNTVSSAKAKTAGNNWVTYLCSRLNRPLVNLAMGSSTAEHWRYANQAGFPDTDIEKANVETSCYFMGIGVNDLRNKKTVGTADDIKELYTENSNTFYGNYDYLVRKLKEFNPFAKIFVFTIPNSENGTNINAINEAIRHIAGLYDNVYCIDLNEEELFTEDFISNNFVQAHYNPITYNYMSVILENILNRYIYDNYEEFVWVPYNY